MKWLLASACLIAVGCAHVFPADYGLEDLRADSEKRPGAGLVHYLSLPTAEPETACHASNFARRDDALVEPFVSSLASRAVKPALWRQCAERLLATLEAAERERLLAELSALALSSIKEGALTRLEVLHQVISRRPRGPSEALAKLLVSLRKPELLSVEALDELRVTLALDQGEWGGQHLTPAMVETLADEPLLRRFDARVPDESVRLAARRRVVRLHIAASTFPEVKARADEVEQRVLATGRWAQPVERLAVPAPQPASTLTISLRGSQDISSQLVRLTTTQDDTRAPAIDVKPVLRFHVGWSAPLPLCAPRDALEVSPCVDATTVELGTGFATLDENGLLRFPPKLTMGDAVELTRKGLGVVVPVLLSGKPAQVLQVPLIMLAPSPFFFEGERASPGPMVNVVVVPATQGLLVDAVDEKGTRRQLVLPRGATIFELGSRGGRGVTGASGSPGSNGSTGTNGMTASCPSMNGGNGGTGGSGGRGGAGGNGGPGGAGGAVKVELLCGSACEDAPLVRAITRSRGGEGGEGGPGGQGGRGGSGGSGGSGTSCYSNGKTSSLSGGSAGSRGSDGAAGSPGQRGAPGLDGTVQVLVR